MSGPLFGGEGTDSLVLRDYQARTIREFFAELREGRRRVMVCAPTGAGKMVVAAALCQRVLHADRRAIFLADRVQIMDQMIAMCEKYGIQHGVQMGERTYRTREPVQIVSIQTAGARNIDLGGEGTLVMIDEAHHQHKHVAERMLDPDSRAVYLGLSATPFGAKLAASWERLLNITTTNRLLGDGHLAPMRVFAPESSVDEDRLDVERGEFTSDSVSSEVLRLTGDIVEEYSRRTREHFGGPVKTIAFAASVAEAEAMAEAFRAESLDFRPVSYLDGAADRARLIQMHREGRVLGLVSPEALQRGYDVPDIRCGILAHPWRRSLAAVVQELGRVMRPATGKEYALVLDHAGNFLRFRSQISELFELGAPPFETRAPRNPKITAEARRVGTCPQCDAVLLSRRCGHCGWEAPAPVAATTPVVTVDGTLVEIGLDEVAKPDRYATIGKSSYELPPRRAGWRMLVALAREERPPDRRQAWCQAQFRNLYGDFFRGREESTEPLAVAPGLRAAVEHSLRLYIQRRSRQRTTA